VKSPGREVGDVDSTVAHRFLASQQRNLDVDAINGYVNMKDYEHLTQGLANPASQRKRARY